MSVVYIYPYEPLRAIILGMNKNEHEKRALWLIVFLMRLGVLGEVSVNTVKLLEFAEKYGNYGEQKI